MENESIVEQITHLIDRLGQAIQVGRYPGRIRQAQELVAELRRLWAYFTEDAESEEDR